MILYLRELYVLLRLLLKILEFSPRPEDLNIFLGALKASPTSTHSLAHSHSLFVHSFLSLIMYLVTCFTCYIFIKYLLAV